MRIEEIKEKIEKNFDTKIEVKEIPCGVKKMKRTNIFVEVKREDFKKLVKFLFELQSYPHLSIISSTDFGEEIELMYHFTVDYGKQAQEKIVSFRVKLPKTDLKIETITDLIPGALISEREMHEMVGVEFIGLKDTRHFFLPENWPDGKYPWRRDSTFPEDMLNKMYERWKEGDEHE